MRERVMRRKDYWQIKCNLLRLFSETCSFTAQFAIFPVLKFPEVRHTQQTVGCGKLNHLSLAYLENAMSNLYLIFFALRCLWLSLNRPLAASRYVVYFRFSRWRHYSMLRYCYHPLCLCLVLQRRLSFYLFHYCYACASFSLILHFSRRFLISKINVALQLTKLWLKKVTTTVAYSVDSGQ